MAKRVSKLITRSDVSKTSLDNEHDIVISDTDNELTTDTDEGSPSDTDEGSPSDTDEGSPTDTDEESPSDTDKESIANADEESLSDIDEEPTIDISKIYERLEMECKKYVKSKEYVYKSVVRKGVPDCCLKENTKSNTHYGIKNS